MKYSRDDTLNVGFRDLSQIRAGLNVIANQCSSVKMQFLPFNNIHQTKMIKILRSGINDNLLNDNSTMYLEIHKFSHYRCSELITLITDVNELSKVITKIINKQYDHCVIFLEKNRDNIINVRSNLKNIEHIKCKREHSKPINILPDLTLYKQLFITSQKLQDICLSLEDISSKIYVKCCMDKIYFTTENDICLVTITHDISTSYIPDQKIKTINSKNKDVITSSTCMISDLLHFINCKNSRVIEIFLNNGENMIISRTGSVLKSFLFCSKQ